MLLGTNFTDRDWYVYYKQISDTLQIKLYFPCEKVKNSYRAVSHTDYADCDDYNLKVVHRIHAAPNQNSCSPLHVCSPGRKGKHEKEENYDEEVEEERNY